MTSESGWNCDQCSRTYRTRARLMQHKIQEHSVGEQPLTATPQTPQATNSAADAAPNNYTDEDTAPVEIDPPAINIPEHNIAQGPSVCFDVFNFYDAFGDITVPLFETLAGLNPDPSSLHPYIQECVNFASRQHFSLKPCVQYYEHILKTQSLLNSSEPSNLNSVFPTSLSFHRFVKNVNKHKVSEMGYKTVRIETEFGVNDTGVFRCPKKVMVDTIVKAGGSSSIIPFEKSFKDGDRVYSSPWNTKLLEKYKICLPYGSVVLFDVYIDGTIMSKSGTQSATVIRIRFPSIKGYTKKWHEIGLAPNMGNILSYIPSGKQSEYRLQLIHRYLFVVCKQLILASMQGVRVSNSIVFPRVGMIIVDQPEERFLLCLKSCRSPMFCSHCEKKSTNENTTSTESVHFVDNNEPRDVSKTVSFQLIMAKHKLRQHQDEIAASVGRHYLHSHSANEYPPVFAAFEGMGSPPFNLYACISFDKLHVMDLGLIRLFADQTPHLLSAGTTTALTKMMEILNDRFVDLPASTGLPLIRPFLESKDDSQAGMSGKRRRQCAPFLWACVMGVRAGSPDEDQLVQCALGLDELNQFLCGVNNGMHPRMLSEQDINYWQEKFFKTGKIVIETFGVNVTTKVHRTMCHIRNFLLYHGCLVRGSTEESEMLHKSTKQGYSKTNKHYDRLNQQLLVARVQSESDSSSASSNDSGVDADVHSSSWGILVHRSIQQFDTLATYHAPADVTSFLLSIREEDSGLPRWRTLKSARVTFSLGQRKVSRNVYAGDVVYGRRDRYDFVVVRFHGQYCFGRIQAILAPTDRSFARHHRMIVIRVLEDAEPHPLNRKVVEDFGNRRLQYCMIQERIKVICVPLGDVMRPAMVILDYFWATMRFGREVRIANILDNASNWGDMKFFEVKGFPYCTLRSEER